MFVSVDTCTQMPPAQIACSEWIELITKWIQRNSCTYSADIYFKGMHFKWTGKREKTAICQVHQRDILREKKIYRERRLTKSEENRNASVFAGQGWPGEKVATDEI